MPDADLPLPKQPSIAQTPKEDTALEKSISEKPVCGNPSSELKKSQIELQRDSLPLSL